MRKINDVVLEGIEKKDREKIITGIYGVIMSDRRMENGAFEEYLEYIRNSGMDIFEDLDKSEPYFEVEDKNYNRDDFRDAAINLKQNFCKERIEVVRTIGRAVYKSRPAQEEKATVSRTVTMAQEKSESRKKQGKNKKGLVIAGIVVVAVVVVGIIAITHN